MRGAIRVIPVLAALALLGPACARAGDRSGASEAEGEPAGTAYSCVETYGLDTLVQRSFAFDGTVLALEVRVDPRLPAGEDDVPWVTFEVNEWFRGDGDSQVGVWIEALNIETSAGTISAKPGTRLLVAGEPRWGGATLEDPIAWPCGFTQPWTPGAAADWRAAFSE